MVSIENTELQVPPTNQLSDKPQRHTKTEKVISIILIILNALIVVPLVLIIGLIQLWSVIDPASQSGTWAVVFILLPVIPLGIIILIFDFTALTIYLMRNVKNKTVIRWRVLIAFLTWISLISFIVYYLYNNLFQP